MDKTVLENNPKADFDSTKTDNESVIKNDKDNNATFTYFKNYKIVKQLPTVGAEADVFITEKDKKNYILKLYRHGIELDKEKVEKILQLSKKYPEDIVQIYEIAKDENLNRWYEIQEYAKYGTLQDLIQNNNEFAKKHVKEIIKEMTLLLDAIHKENIIHRDIKPQNILIRSMNPIDLILTDFGISSIIKEDISKIMTSKSGTKIYFAPESFSGIIGYEVDYWALGMIILEIFEGSNIFKGLNEGLIAHEIFTKGVEVPEYLDEDIKILLKGLLTRNPKKRWSSKQIFQWLYGNINIEVFYEYDNEKTKALPYKFNSKTFYSLRELLKYMFTPSNYEKAKTEIMRGHVTQWLEKREMFDDAVTIDKFKTSSKNADIAFFNIYNYFIKPENFVWKGEIINLENILNYLNSNEEIATFKEAYEIYTQNREKNKDWSFILNYIDKVPNNEKEYFLKLIKEKGFGYKYLLGNPHLIINLKVNFKDLYDFSKSNKKLNEIEIPLNIENYKDALIYMELSEKIKKVKDEWSEEKKLEDKIDNFLYKKKQEILQEWNEINSDKTKIITSEKLKCLLKKFDYIAKLDKQYKRKIKYKLISFFLTILAFITLQIAKHTDLDINKYIPFGIVVALFLMAFILVTFNLFLNYKVFFKPKIKWQKLCKNLNE